MFLSVSSSKPHQIAIGSLERFAALVVRFENQFACAAADVPNEDAFDGIGNSWLGRCAKQRIRWNHSGPEFAYWTQNYALDDVASTLRRIARRP
jgi:hypothetical protein